MRQRIYEITEVSKGNDTVSTVYDIFMLVMIIAGLVPLALFNHDGSSFLIILDKSAACVFIVDYILRFITADLRDSRRKKLSAFILYPLTPAAILDLLSILPSFIPAVSSGFRLFKLVRLLKTLKLLRLLKAARYSRSISLLTRVVKAKKEILITILTVAVGYIVVTALVIVTVEPQSFENFFEALYWACVSLTTVGYGDLYPVSTIGRVIAMISSFGGIAVVALPAAVLTSGFQEALEAEKNADPTT